MEAHKIDVTDYFYNNHSEKRKKDGTFELDDNGEPIMEDKLQKVSPKVHLPLMLCNPNLTQTPGQTDKDFDLFELGTIAKKIEKADTHVILDKAEYDTLKSRIEIIQKYLNYKYFEMVRRVHEAEKVELKEA